MFVILLYLFTLIFLTSLFTLFHVSGISIFGTVEEALPAATDAEEILKLYVYQIVTHRNRIQWQEWLPAHGFSKIKNDDGTVKNEADIHAMDLLAIDIGPYYVELIGETQASKK